MAVSPSLVGAIVQELKAEHAEVLLPLVGKLKELADQLEADVAVPAERIRAGLALWARYGTEIRAEAIRRLLTPLSALSGASECTQRFRELNEESSVENARIPNLERLLKSYASGQFAGRPILLGSLVSSIEASRAWARFEEDYATRCLVQAPPPGAEASIAQWLEQARTIRAQLAAEVRAYITGPTVPVPVGVPS